MPNFPPESFPHFPPFVGCFAKSDSPHPSCATRMEQWRRRWILKDLTTFPPETFPEGLRPPEKWHVFFWPRPWHEEWVPMNGLLIFVIIVLWVNTLQFLGSKWSMTPKATFSWREEVLFDCFFLSHFHGKRTVWWILSTIAAWLADMSHSFFLKIFVLRMLRILRHARLYLEHFPQFSVSVGQDNLTDFRIFVLPKASHVFVFQQKTPNKKPKQSNQHYPKITKLRLPTTEKSTQQNPQQKSFFLVPPPISSLSQHISVKLSRLFCRLKIWATGGWWMAQNFPSVGYPKRTKLEIRMEKPQIHPRRLTWNLKITQL